MTLALVIVLGVIVWALLGWVAWAAITGAGRGRVE